AAQVARALGLHHTAIPVTGPHLLAHAPLAPDQLDGAPSPRGMYELWFADTPRAMAATVVYGVAGGPLGGDDKAAGLPGPAAVRDRQWRRYAGEARVTASFLARGLAAGAESMLRDSLAESLSGWDLRARDDMVIYWKVANRQFR